MTAGASTPISDALVEEIRTEFPRFRLVPKAGDTLSRAIDLALKLLTFGRQNRYLTEYHTVLSYTLFVPASWNRATDLERAVTLRHERIHLRQRRRLGSLLMTVIYLLPFLPLGLAYGRARLEWEAYAETLRATAEFYGLEAAKSPELRRRIVRRFTGPDYGWMWPFERRVQAWYDAVVEELTRTNFAAPNRT